MKTRLVIVLVALASLAVIAPAQGVKKPVAKKTVVTKKAAPVAKKAAPVAKSTAKKPGAKKHAPKKKS